MSVSTHPDLSPCLLHASNLSRYGDLVALLLLTASVGVWEVDVAFGVVHHPLNDGAPFADDMRVLRVRHVHLQRHTVTLWVG